MADRETDNNNNNNNVERRTTIKIISTNQTIKLNDAIMVAGFPGPGLVSAL